MNKNISIQTEKTLSAKINSVLIRYAKSQLIIIMVTTTISWAIFTVLKVDYPLLLAVITGSLSVIPLFGMSMAAIVSALFAIFDGTRFLPNMHPIFEGLVILVLYFVFNILIDYVLSPYLTGKITNVHPVILLASIILGTMLFGILGTFLAVPLVLIIKTIREHNDDNKVN